LNVFGTIAFAMAIIVLGFRVARFGDSPRQSATTDVGGAVIILLVDSGRLCRRNYWLQ
jgi:hypothetical protein